MSTDPSITRVVFDKGKPHSYTISSYHKLKRPLAEAHEPKYQEVARYRPISDGVYQHFFGEASFLKTEPRPRNLTLTCLTDVTVRRLSAPKFLELKHQQDRKDDLLRGALRGNDAPLPLVPPCSPLCPVLQPRASRLQPYVLQASSSLRTSPTTRSATSQTFCSRDTSRTLRPSSFRSGYPYP